MKCACAFRARGFFVFFGLDVYLKREGRGGGVMSSPLKVGCGGFAQHVN